MATKTAAAQRVAGDLAARVLAELRARGTRVTTPRRLLVQALVEAGGHRTAEELAAAVAERAPDVHLSTIYRNLEELERSGIAVHVHLGHGPATYHLASELHAHLVCERCGVTIEVPESLFGTLGRVTLRDYGFRIDAHHFAMPGRCRKCAARFG